MTDDITIPPAALEAVAKIIKDSFFTNDSDAENVARAACLAMLKNWPGAFRNDMEEAAGVRRRVILPLTQEKTNENGH